MDFRRSWMVGIIALALIALALGCSDKQEQAQQLEQEMMEPVPALDTTADTMQVESTLDDEVDASAVPQEEPTYVGSLPQAPAGNGYTVQVAGCEDRAYAEYLVGLYQRRGYEPFVTQATVDGQLYYRVRVGNFDTFEAARALRKEITGRFSVDGWVDRIGGY